MAEIGDHAIDQRQDLRRRAEAAVHRQIEELGGIDSRPAASLARALNQARKRRLDRTRGIGALEAEDRLLVVADREDGAMASSRRPSPAEIFERERAHDVPLPLRWCPAPRRPGYGRSTGRACSAPNRPCRGSAAAARPSGSGRRNRPRRGRAWRRHKRARSSGRRAGPRRAARRSAATLRIVSSRCAAFDEPRRRARHNRGSALSWPAAESRGLAVLLDHRYRRARRAVAARSAGVAGQPVRRSTSQQSRPVVRPPLRLAAAIRRSACEVEQLVAAVLRRSLPRCRRREAEGAAEARLDALARRRAPPSPSGARAHCIRKASAPPSPSRWLSAWTSRISAEIAAAFARDQQIGERLARQQLLLPPLQRPEARDQPRLGRKGREQRLGEGVDGLDAKAAAGRVEHPREQGARPSRSVSGPRSSPSATSSAPSSASFEPHPVSEPGVDALGHLGRARLGEGEAQDRGRIDSGQQQAEDAGGEDVGLAGAGRGRKRGMIGRARSAQLLVLEARQGLQTLRQFEESPASETML